MSARRRFREATDREWPPQPVAHTVDCSDGRSGTLTTTSAAIKDGHEPTLHDCTFVRTHRHVAGPIRLTPADYPEHEYEGSMIWPASATRSLCITCHGTHEGEE